MKNRYLFEYIDEIRKSENKEEKIRELLENSNFFKDFFEITYNKKYKWEFDTSYNKKPRNLRKNGGCESESKNAIRFIKRRLLRTTGQGKNFIKQFDRILDNVNVNDIQIILCALKNRSIRYITTKNIYKFFPEYNNDNEE